MTPDSAVAASKTVAAAYGAIIVTRHRWRCLDPFRRSNAFIANLETAIRGTYHRFKLGKCTRRYIAEAQYHIDRRFETHSLVGRLLHACAQTAPNPERRLRHAAVRAG